MKALDYDATVEKIMKGDIPEVSVNATADYIRHIPDNLGIIYSNLMAKMILNGIPDDTPQEIISERVNLFDRLMSVVSQCRFGRLMNMIDGLNSVTSMYLTRSDVFQSNKVRNNVLGFAIDWWLYDSEQRNNVLVTVDMPDEDEVKEEEAATEDTEADNNKAEGVELVEEEESTDVG